MRPDFNLRYPPAGLPEIDRDHERIDLTLQRLSAAVSLDSPDQAAAARGALLAEVAAHFRHEERLMREIHYPDLTRHHRAHQAFLAGARRIRIRNSRADTFLSSRFVHWAARVQEWFRSHALKEDFRLGQAVLAARAAPA